MALNEIRHKVVDFGDLHIVIYVLGYVNEGESIMIELKCGKDVLFRVLTDCYLNSNGTNYWIDNADRFAGIDAFVWTHPDKDHTLGIPETLDKLDSGHTAQIYLPSSMDGDFLRREGKVDAAESLKYLLDNYNSGRRYAWNEISLADGEVRDLLHFSFVERLSGHKIAGELKFLLPQGAIIARRKNSAALSGGQMNDFSIVYVLCINGQSYVFTGDLKKQNIQFLSEDSFWNSRYLKIPHHGSKEPTGIIDLLDPYDSNGIVSTTTVFGDEMPYAESIEKYKKKSSVIYSTSRGESEYGLITLDFPLKEDNHDVYLEGNAIELK